MASHKIYYQDKNGNNRVHEFYGSDAGAAGWAQVFEREGGRVEKVLVQDHYTREVKEMPRKDWW